MTQNYFKICQNISPDDSSGNFVRGQWQGLACSEEEDVFWWKGTICNTCQLNGWVLTSWKTILNSSQPRNSSSYEKSVCLDLVNPIGIRDVCTSHCALWTAVMYRMLHCSCSYEQMFLEWDHIHCSIPSWELWKLNQTKYWYCIWKTVHTNFIQGREYSPAWAYNTTIWYWLRILVKHRCPSFLPSGSHC